MKIIYEPKGMAKEYAALALNIYKGCTHRCIYCYNNGRFGKEGDFFEGSKPKTDIIRRLIADCRYLLDKYGDDCPEILLTFLGDAYQPSEATLGFTRLAAKTLINFNLPFTILTKSSLINRDIEILAPYPKFRLGLSFTSLTQAEVDKWEPGTGYVRDRINTLLKFKDRGVKTWVSLEPIMRVESTLQVIQNYYRHIDFWRIGALNHINPPEPIDWSDAKRRIEESLKLRRCCYEFKRGLAEL